MPLQNSHLLNSYMSNQVIKEEAPELKEKLDVSRKECPLSKEIQKLILRQLKHELQNHNIYMDFANYYGVRGFVLLEEYYELRAKEEYAHYQWIRKFLNFNDSAYIHPTIDQYPIEINSMITPFEITVNLEVKTTQMIDEIINQAADECDWGTFNWLLGHDKEKGMLREEQVNFCLAA